MIIDILTFVSVFGVLGYGIYKFFKYAMTDCD